MSPTIDSFRYISGITRRVVRSWIAQESPRPIPWTPLRKPVSESTLAVISSAGLALKSDRPFDQQGERDNPWWGDPSYRSIPRTARTGDVTMYHMHVDPFYVNRDLNVLLPLERLAELEENNAIGKLAPTAYSFMGYNLKPDGLLEETTPAIINGLQQEAVEIVLLVPA
ncbi:MAG: glycine/sarcosine/betaine reductase selenoprotein B family protein [Anaerolineales bacterium]